MRALLPTLMACLALTLGAHAQFATPDYGQSQPLEKFDGENSQTTQTFKVGDKWQVRWHSMLNLNVSVIAEDGTVVAGATAMHGALYVPKGGTYHLQIDCVPRPGMNQSTSNPPPSNGPSGFDNAINHGWNNNGSSNPQQSPNSSSNSYQQTMLHWHVEVVEAGAPAVGYGANYVLPGASGNNATLAPTAPQPTSPSGTASVTPLVTAAAPITPPAAPLAPAPKMTEDQARALVLIKGDNAEGTGFMIRTMNGPAVITNIHVIANNPNLKITTNTGALVTVLSEKGASDRDLAMLAIQDAGYNYLEFSPDISKSVQPGDDVITPGNSQGGEVMLNTSGKVLGIGPVRLEFDNPIYHGNSGGPVFHPKSGKVLGVVTEAIKVDTSNDLDKASFSSRNSAISGSMRYFGLRLDTVAAWIPIDSRRFQIETTFLDEFHEQSRRLDAYLNHGDNDRDEAARLFHSDAKIMKANDNYAEKSSGADTAQHIDLIRSLVFDLQCVADINMDQIREKNNFYLFDQERAQDECDYRAALKKELDSIANNVERASFLPRSNN